MYDCLAFEELDEVKRLFALGDTDLWKRKKKERERERESERCYEKKLERATKYTRYRVHVKIRIRAADTHTCLPERVGLQAICPSQRQAGQRSLK